MKKLNNASLPLSFAGGKYSTESVKLPDGQYIIKIVATGPCIGKILKGSEVLAEVDFSSYKLLSYNDLKISFILYSESEISLEVTPKREDVKVYSASLSSSILPVGGDEYPTPTGTINITENGENIDVKQYAKANVNVSVPTLSPVYSFSYYHEQYGSATFAAGTGIGGSSLGWEMLVGETYDMVVIASPEVAQHLDKLYLKADNHDEKRDFTKATVTTTTVDGQTFARIELTNSYPSLSGMHEVGLYYNGTKYVAVVAG